MPTLAGSLLRGALLSPFRRPRADAAFPRAPLTLPEVRIDLARLAAYERICGFPTGEDALPPTYPHVLGFPLAMRLMSARAFPLPLLGLVHTSFDLTRHTALPATAAYELSVRVEGLAPHRRGTEAAVLTELRSGGQTVWESRSTYLARHGTDRPADPRTGRTTTPPSGQTTTPATGQTAASATGRATTPATDQTATPATGQTTEPATGPTTTPATDQTTTPATDAASALPPLAAWPLGGDLGRRYAAVSGDRNPIHLHPLTARLFGFPRPIAHGMWTLARCLAAHGTPDAVRVRARFLAPVPLPGTVEFAAEKGRFALRGGGRVHLTATVDPLGSGPRR
ncbi:MaoC/PaaZ C-terminal domain-containing protein [Streptomyces sp. NPDC052687]|uniref:MaoC family dehydratase n=1 Tax=Streptomyces sp. NPDC052687 TaxID=3154759 RepID=UPI0034268600